MGKCRFEHVGIEIEEQEPGSRLPLIALIVAVTAVAAGAAVYLLTKGESGETS